MPGLVEVAGPPPPGTCSTCLKVAGRIAHGCRADRIRLQGGSHRVAGRPLPAPARRASAPRPRTPPRARAPPGTWLGSGFDPNPDPDPDPNPNPNPKGGVPLEVRLRRQLGAGVITSGHVRRGARRRGRARVAGYPPSGRLGWYRARGPGVRAEQGARSRDLPPRRQDRLGAKAELEERKVVREAVRPIPGSRSGLG